MLGDGAIEKYGREDLYDVFRAIMPFGLFKACESAWYLVEPRDSDKNVAIRWGSEDGVVCAGERHTSWFHMYDG